MKATTSGWTRRSFLATAGCGLVGLALPRTGLGQSGRGLLMRGERSGRVLVLGAGLAGLAAAWELVEAGHEVIVLEARSRPGGRILTLREPFTDALFAEAGGIVLDPSYRHFHRYLGLFDPQAVALDYDPELGSVAHLRGQRIVTPAGGGPRTGPTHCTMRSGASALGSCSVTTQRTS